MELNKDNLKIFAAQHYVNPSCLTQREFESDLSLSSTILRHCSRYSGGDDGVNVKTLLNNFIMFYNVFEKHAASTILEFKSSSENINMIINSFLYFLSMPLIGRKEYDVLLHKKIIKAYRI